MYCDCGKGGVTNFVEVETKKGVCIHCGHYALHSKPNRFGADRDNSICYSEYLKRFGDITIRGYFAAEEALDAERGTKRFSESDGKTFRGWKPSMGEDNIYTSSELGYIIRRDREINGGRK